MMRPVMGVFLCLLGAPRTAGSTAATAMDGTIRVATANIYSIGFEWDLTGDDHHNARCSARYRVMGTSTWKETIGLLRIDYQGWYGAHTDLAYRHFNMFAGSIMFLSPGTTYEIELSVTDPDGGDVTRTLSISTRSEPVLSPLRTLHVAPGSGGGSGSASDPYRGLDAAEASAVPGDVFLLHAGAYPGHIWSKSGSAGKYVALKAAGDGDAVLEGELGVNCSYLWIQGLTFASTAVDATGGVRGEVSYANGPSDVVVVRNTFQTVRYAISNPDQSWDGNTAQPYRRWYIADNVGLGGPKNEYFMRFYVLADSDVCYNRISTTLNGLGGDGVSIRFATNDDVYHNDL